MWMIKRKKRKGEKKERKKETEKTAQKQIRGKTKDLKLKKWRNSTFYLWINYKYPFQLYFHKIGENEFVKNGKTVKNSLTEKITRDFIKQLYLFLSDVMLKCIRHHKGGFHLHLLVFPFVYQFNSRIGALVHSLFAND